MTRHTRSNDWGFPALALLWRQGTLGGQIRLCDREGCSEMGDRPAPKAPNSPERWYFCETHASEYNRNWNYFAGLSAEEAARREADEELGASRASANQHNGNGRAPATARRTATRCGRSMRWSWRTTPISRR